MSVLLLLWKVRLQKQGIEYVCFYLLQCKVILKSGKRGLRMNYFQYCLYFLFLNKNVISFEFLQSELIFVFLQVRDEQHQCSLGNFKLPLSQLLESEDLTMHQRFHLSNSGPNSTINMKIALRVLKLFPLEIAESIFRAVVTPGLPAFKEASTFPLMSPAKCPWLCRAISTQR